MSPNYHTADALRTDDALAETLAAVGILLDSGRGLEAVVRTIRLLPPDQGALCQRLTARQRARLIEHMPERLLGEVIEYMPLEITAEITESMSPIALARIMDCASPNIAADILKNLSEEVSAEVLAHMKSGNEVASLLAYEDDDAGGLMTPEFIAISQQMTVTQAMSAIRQWAREYASDEITQAYVVGRDGALMGSLTLATLVLSRPYQRVSLVMDSDTVSVTTETDQEEVARLMERYDLQRIPVIGDSGMMAGVIRLEDIIDVAEEEATEDMFRMVGVSETEKASGQFWRSVRGRLPWLCVNLATAILAGLVVTMFEHTLAQAVALAAFLPVIAGQGGIAGTQTLTLIVRSIALGELVAGTTWRLLLKELGLGLIHGVVVGILVAAIAFGLERNEYIALVVGVAMVANMMVAAVSGVIVPLGLQAMRIDPALASAVAVTTLTDVLGFLIYLGLATALIQLIAGS